MNFNVLRAALPYSSSIFVNEYPKSGGTWLSRLISDIYTVPFRRSSEKRLGGVGHGHYLYVAAGRPRIIMWRDPRDVIVSYYHHVFYRSDGVALKLRERFERKMSSHEDWLSTERLKDFSDLVMKGGAYPRFGYEDFCQKFVQADSLCHTSYEALSHNAEEELRRITEKLSLDFGLPHVSENLISNVVQKNHFSSISGRKNGIERKGNALRKGVVGDYKNYFSASFLAEFENQYRELLIKVERRTLDSNVL